MDVLDQIISTFRPMIPENCETAQAIDRGASIEEICACAAGNGLHHFVSALFSADVVVAHNDHGPINADESLLDDIDSVLADYEHRLPPNCETVRLVKTGAELELISQAAETEGLHDLAAMLFEAEQVQVRTDQKAAFSKRA